MRIVRTQMVDDGAVLACDVFGGPHGTIPLLRAGVAIDTRYRDALQAAGISRVAVHDLDTEGIEVRDALAMGSRLEANARLGQILSKVRSALAANGRIGYDIVTTAEGLAALLLDEALQSGTGPVSLLPASGPQTHGVRHPIDVVVLGLITARLLFTERGRIIAGVRTTEGTEDALRRISLGLLLHDIGHDEHAEDVQVKDGLIVEGDGDRLHAHTTRVHAALPHSLISAHAAAVIRDHHERWLGSGPAGLAGASIPQFARIAAVVDVFDEVTSDRPGRPGVPAHVAVEAICRGAGVHFDPEVVDVFRRVVAPYPVGTEVALSDGTRGVVSFVPPDTPHRPTVRVLRDPEGGRVASHEVELHRTSGLAVALAA